MITGILDGLVLNQRFAPFLTRLECVHLDQFGNGVGCCIGVRDERRIYGAN